MTKVQPHISTSSKTSNSRLLQLPGEIRNRIWRFALTSSEPLHHRQPRTKLTQQLSIASHHHRLVEEKYILDGSTLNPPSFNKLKFVNRQLWAETAGLELHFNAVVFSSQIVRKFNRDPNASIDGFMKKCAEEWFFSFCAPMKVQCVDWLKTVIIAPDPQVWGLSQGYSPPMPHLPMLAMFCKSHPSVQIRYQFDDFKFGDERKNSSLNFLRAGVALTVALKGDKDGEDAALSLLGCLPRIREDNELARNWRETWNIEYLMKNVKNFAFWPKMNSKYARDAHARSCRLRHDADVLLVNDPQLFDKWLSYTKLWCEHGISNTV
ncbi:hypothetical protein BDU57DRAFT_515880 [Ampelomyces quisqualis]|uniref:Uncharacterized protein n=1 Tax=Ampelomyces quisqualis TaxID=50730 RepID=A0A6A5QJZ3_AMPQU|nr:hypothetical protein BDU57DRAFT_515880 [Ampelomyces quisqualis]